ncbi:MAG: tRNA (N6-threonylcarbamoyladenosine(37)-N6)-methyltransferase TrmO [Verrucomicrobia bacterium]|nr:MAG: tRNA (N6-threonylcarbamoyladenosine(37)-N6)-methyltransferase TrmO [Verrucomicrobiota bacterium]
MSEKNDPRITLPPIGTIHSCYVEKFGIPRQSGLVKSATAMLELLPPYDTPDSLRGLEEFSHLWIIFVFHQSMREHPPSSGFPPSPEAMAGQAGVTSWKATVRPPRLGGNERIGVFSSRSNFRPNPIGLSVVELLDVQGTTLKLGGGDFLDGTPVLDIKPYLPYADRIPEATGAYANAAPERANHVEFSPGAERAIQALEDETRPALRKLVCDMLAYNPRPAYQPDDPDRVFGTRIFDLDLRWKQLKSKVTVLSVDPILDACG